MATLESIQAFLDQFARDQLVRDEGIRRAFENLCSAIERQTATLDLIGQMVKDGNDTALDAMRAAMDDALDDYFNPMDTTGVVTPPGAEPPQ
jgi:20S proteasome alpha/beta subunit